MKCEECNKDFKSKTVKRFCSRICSEIARGVAYRKECEACGETRRSMFQRGIHNSCKACLKIKSKDGFDEAIQNQNLMGKYWVAA